MLNEGVCMCDGVHVKNVLANKSTSTINQIRDRQLVAVTGKEFSFILTSSLQERLLTSASTSANRNIAGFNQIQ